MGGGGIPIVSSLIGGVMGQQGANAQADAMSDASAQAAASAQQAAAMQQQMGEKGLLSQLYMAQQAIDQANRGTQLELQREARALQAVEPFRRIGYGVIPSLLGLYQDTQQNRLQAEVPPELQQMFDVEQQDAQRMLNRQLAQQGTLGSPIGAATAGDQFRRLLSDQTTRGYATGMEHARMEDARRWGRAMELLNMGANMGTAGYQQGAGSAGQMSNIYSALGQNMGSTLGQMGQGMGNTLGSMSGVYANMGPQMANAAGGSYANWANQLGSLAGSYMNNPSAFGGGRAPQMSGSGGGGGGGIWPSDSFAA